MFLKSDSTTTCSTSHIVLLNLVLLADYPNYKLKKDPFLMPRFGVQTCFELLFFILLYYYRELSYIIGTNFFSSIRIFFFQAGRDLKFISLSMSGCFSLGGLLLLVRSVLNLLVSTSRVIGSLCIHTFLSSAVEQ